MNTKRIQKLIKVNGVPHVMNITVGTDDGPTPFGDSEIIRVATQQELETLPWETYFTDGVVRKETSVL